MKKGRFEVAIESDGNTISGNAKSMSCENSVEFSVLNVLGDLLDTVDEKENPQSSLDKEYFLKEGYQEHPFFLLCNPQQGTNRFKFLMIAISELKKIIQENKSFSNNSFEILEQFFAVKFTYTIEFKESNALFDLNYSGAEPFKYEPLQYSYNYDMKYMLNENSGKFHRFKYNCTSMEDMIFATLHYLMLFKYRFGKCKHCGTYFASKTLKQEYCTRTSPYIAYQHLRCEPAVRNIRQKLMRRKNNVIDYMDNYFATNVKNDFLNEFNDYYDKVKDCSSVQNLWVLEQFLNKDNVKQKWYKDEYRLKSIKVIGKKKK